MNIRTVHLFVFNAMSDWEAASAAAAINHPRFNSALGRYRVVTAAATLDPVVTMGGARIQPDVRLDSIRPDSSALLILPGGGAWEDGDNAEALELAARFIASCVPVAAICGATLALARTGLFDNRSGSAREYVISSGNRGTAFYCGAPAAAGQNLTQASSLAPVDFAREIFKALNLDPTAPVAAHHSMFRQRDASTYYALAAR